jgi:hypothetical protein
MSTKLIEDLKTKTVPQLRSYAKKNNIDLFGVNTKVEILEVIFSFIPTTKQIETKKTNEKNDKDEKIAVFSSRNLFWNGVGDLTYGYTILPKEVSEKWLSHKAVRIATPEEVAKHYKVKK